MRGLRARLLCASDEALLRAVIAVSRRRVCIRFRVLSHVENVLLAVGSGVGSFKATRFWTRLELF